MTFVISSDFTRMSTAYLPFFLASPTALRTSVAVATLAPAYFKDDVATLEPMLERNSVGVDLSHHDAF
jgi:hypothetical protein